MGSAQGTIHWTTSSSAISHLKWFTKLGHLVGVPGSMVVRFIQVLAAHASEVPRGRLQWEGWIHASIMLGYTTARFLPTLPTFFLLFQETLHSASTKMKYDLREISFRRASCIEVGNVKQKKNSSCQ